MDQDNHRKAVNRRRVVGTLLTAAISVGLTLVAWVLLVALFDRRVRGYESLLWAGSLWLSALVCTGLIAYSRHSVQPVLGCTTAFGAFGLLYMLFEGPIFGAPSEGGDPVTTEFVVANLLCLPLGVFAASEIGQWLGQRRRRRLAATE